MPAGPAKITGGVIRRVPGLAKIELADLPPLTRPRHVIPAPAELEGICVAIDELIDLYVGAVIAKDHLTATERAKVHRRISTAAAKLVSRPAAHWAQKFIHAVRHDLDLNGRAALSRALLRVGLETETQVDLFSLLDRLTALPMLKKAQIEPLLHDGHLACLEAARAHCSSPIPQDRRDPNLRLLIQGLVRPWRDLTGYSPFHEEVPPDDLVPELSFGEWIHRLVTTAIAPALAAGKVGNIDIPPGRVIDELRRMKSENPAGITPEWS